MNWKENWENYLQKKYGDKIPEEPIKLNLGEVDFYIPPLLGVDTDSMKAIAKHNAKVGVFTGT